MLKRLAGAAFLSLALGPVAVGWGAARADTTLVVGIASDPTGFDPEAVLNNTSGFVMSTLYDSLVRYAPGTTEPAPGLAERWDVSADRLTYTFHLRQGVKFSDGTPFNAPAYVRTLDRQLKKDDPAYIYNTGPVEGYIDFTFGAVQSYRAVDDNTVEFKLKQPDAPFLTSLAMVWNGVVSPDAALKAGKDFRNHPVGTGPFVLRDWRQRDEIDLDANPAYWGGKPKLDHLVFKEYPDPQAAVLALRRGDIQILADVSTQSVPAIRADPDLVLMTQPGLATNGVGLPTETPPFNDVRVRQAMNYAIDRDSIDRALYAGLAVPMTSPLPESQWSFDPALKGYPYDPKKAQDLLAQAGVKPNTLKVELLSYNSPRGYNPAGPNLAVAIQGYLKRIGVQADVRQEEIGAFFSTIRSGHYGGMFLVGWTGDNGDPDNFLNALYGEGSIPVTNTPHFRSPELEALLKQALTEPDHDKRVDLYKQAQRVVLDGAPWIFVNSVLQVRAASKRVQGFKLNPTQMFFDMQDVSLAQ